jgi:hypothetical protein
MQRVFVDRRGEKEGSPPASGFVDAMNLPATRTLSFVAHQRIAMASMVADLGDSPPFFAPRSRA